MNRIVKTPYYLPGIKGYIIQIESYDGALPGEKTVIVKSERDPFILLHIRQTLMGKGYNCNIIPFQLYTENKIKQYIKTDYSGVKAFYDNRLKQSVLMAPEAFVDECFNDHKQEIYDLAMIDEFLERCDYIKIDRRLLNESVQTVITCRVYMYEISYCMSETVPSPRNILERIMRFAIAFTNRRNNESDLEPDEILELDCAIGSLNIIVKAFEDAGYRVDQSSVPYHFYTATNHKNSANNKKGA